MTAIDILRRLDDHGYTSYFVGGMVRDMLLGRRSKDIDIATAATPEAVATIFPRTLDIGTKFGVTFVVEDGEVFEVATFRHDGEYTDGRRPDSVSFTRDVKLDVERRDFTINGLLFDPLRDRVIDLVGGKDDIKNRVIRAIGDPMARFAEDHHRMMRAVRFAANLGFTIEETTLAAIKKMAPKILSISQERIRDELLKMLRGGNAGAALKLLHDTGLLEFILPEVAALDGVEQPPEFHPEGDVLQHTIKLLDHMPTGVDPDLALAGLLHDVGKPSTFEVGPERITFKGHAKAGASLAEAVCRRLHLTRASRDKVVFLVRHHMDFRNIMTMRRSKLIRFMRHDHFGDLLALHKMDRLAASGILESYEFAKREFETLPPPPPAPLVTGKDLIKMGFKPGPAFGEILSAIEDAQLEGRVTTREAALKLAHEMVAQH